MLRGRGMPTFILAGLLLGTGILLLRADSTNPYAGIAERNLFGLKPPTPHTRPAPPTPPPPKITLTGITTILGDKRALFKVLEPAKPPARPKPKSFILKLGQRDGDLQVLAIDEKAGSVKVNNHGTIQELTFEKNGQKLPSTPRLAGTRRGWPNLPFRRAVPGQPGGRRIPTRTLRLPPLPKAHSNGLSHARSSRLLQRFRR